MNKLELLDYFIKDEKELDPSYLKKCKKYFRDIEKKEGFIFKGKFKPNQIETPSTEGVLG